MHAIHRTATALAITGLAMTLPAGAQQPNRPGPGVDPGTIDLGWRQDAWEAPHAHLPGHQQTPGYAAYVYSPTQVYRVLLRPGFTTTIRLDPGEHIMHAVLGDPGAFETAMVTDSNPTTPDNTIEVRAYNAGIDTSLKLMTASGQHYSFVLSSVPSNHDHVTDLIVDILRDQAGLSAGTRHNVKTGDTMADSTRHRAIFSDPAGTANGTGPAADATGGRAAIRSNPELLAADPRLRALNAGSARIDPQATGSAWGNLDNAGFDPAGMIYDISAFASTREAAAAIAPVRVWRDQHWTFIDFGAKAQSMSRLPTPTLVDDDTENLVAFRFIGEDNQIMVVEAVGNIALVSGPHVVCLILDGHRQPVGTSTVRSGHEPAPVEPPQPAWIEPIETDSGTGTSGTERTAARAEPGAREQEQLRAIHTTGEIPASSNPQHHASQDPAPQEPPDSRDGTDAHTGRRRPGPVQS